MAWARWMVCATALLFLLLGGCAPDSFSLSFWQRDSSSDRSASSSLMQTGLASSNTVLLGSMDTVSLLCQAYLGTQGLQAQVQQVSEGLRINSVTKSGKRFSLLLTKDTTTGDEHTNVRIEWTDGADNQLWSELQLFAARRSR